MTRTGPRKPVGDSHWRGRLDSARGHHRSARELFALAEPGQAANPIISLLVLAAIAYSDALVASLTGTVNQQDHRAAVHILRAAAGKRLSNTHERQLTRILNEKDGAQYGARHMPLERARALLEELDAFAKWVEAELQR